jgi:hypothetical protein
MNRGRYVIAQLLDHLPLGEFHECVNRYRGERKVTSFSCLDQYLCMAFAQLTCRDSLRDIVACLRSKTSSLYHAGFRGKISRSTLADANERRDWRIYADFAQVLIAIARPLYAGESLAAEMEQAAYVLDSTTIRLSLSLCPWAYFRRLSGAVKMHTLLALEGNIPSFIRITHGLVHDVNMLDQIPIEPGAFYIMDRAYLDFERLHRLHQYGAFFVTRPKSDFAFERLSSRRVDKTTGLICDQTIRLKSFYPLKSYPDSLRRIRYCDRDTKLHLCFLTNNFALPALTVAQLYKQRWQIEIFFKWIKQHLRIKAFYGLSENAVKTQIWIAVSVYVLVAILKKRLHLDLELYEILQILSISLFEKRLLQEVLTTNDGEIMKIENTNQLTLFEL